MAQTTARAYPNSQRPDDPQIASLKLPPHSIEASNRCSADCCSTTRPGRIADIVNETIFIATITGAFSAASNNSSSSQAGRCGHGVRGDRETQRSRAGRRPRLSRRNCQQHPFGGQHPPLCRNRARTRRAAPPGQRRRRNRRQALNPAGKDVKQLLDQAKPAYSKSPNPARAPARASSPFSRCWGSRRPHPGAVRTGKPIRHNRRADRLHRPR